MLSTFYLNVKTLIVSLWCLYETELCVINVDISEMVFQPSTNAEHLVNRETGQITQSISMYLPLLCCKGQSSFLPETASFVQVESLEEMLPSSSLPCFIMQFVKCLETLHGVRAAGDGGGEAEHQLL